MDGGSFSDILRIRKTIPEPILSIMVQKLLIGLSYLHRVRHLVYRDIKPANLLGNLKGEPKIKDFGISVGLEDSMAMCATFVGTVTYMSPERIRNENYSYPADIWSLGLALFECATSEFPYSANEGPVNLMLQRIENKVNRQVTFSKRKSGLMKKANEISVLCDAEVAVMVFSTKGKLFHYSTHHSSMERIIAKYEGHNADNNLAADSAHKENSYVDHPKLQARVEFLQKSIRNYDGEDLDPLSLRELQSLQHQLDTSLKRIRMRKNQLMLESISHLRKQVKEMEKQKMVEHTHEEEEGESSNFVQIHTSPS
ncbi:mitogen-activated protein kinase kinase 3 [Perilla frutescens var. hirtella]|nr:mitogen-activated protein kinase kinase 3 [Perilla frutescens var. hirtella]